MTEISLLWICPSCEKSQGRVLRFKNEEVLNDMKIIQRARKARLVCKYCGKAIAWTKLERQHRLGFEDVFSSRKTGVLNKLELR